MGKDPAILFYTSDFISGTLTMTNEQRGKYIILLCLQHQGGHLSYDDMIMVCGGEDSKIFAKFLIDEDGKYYQKRMESEVVKRAKHSDKQRENIMKRWNKSGNTTVLPLEDEDENIIINRIELREEIFKEKVFNFKQYPNSLLQEFSTYWTEPNKSGTKMRFELERTWDLKRRLERWANNSFGKKEEIKPKRKNTQNVERILNEDYTKYKRGETRNIGDLIKPK